MKILITNDDSIKANGLKKLALYSGNYGKVFIVAPLNEQSAKSHAINVVNGFKMKQYNIDLKFETYYCDSTPADCVRSAHFALKKDFDYVFSGINNGYNLGEDITYSGTVAAAVEGAFLGKKAIAFSVKAGTDSVTCEQFQDIMNYIYSNKLWDFTSLLNINIPCNPKGIRITKQGKTYFDTQFVLIDDLWYQRGAHRYELERDNTTDVWAVNNGYISITPLAVERSANKVLERYIK